MTTVKKDVRKINLTLFMRGFDGGPLMGTFYITCGSLHLHHVTISEFESGIIEIPDVEVDCNRIPIFEIHGQPFIEEFPISVPFNEYYYRTASIPLNDAKNVVIKIQQKRDKLTFKTETSETKEEVWKEIFARKYGIASGTIAKVFVDASMNFEFEDHNGGSTSTTEGESLTYTVHFPLPKLLLSQQGGENNDLK